MCDIVCKHLNVGLLILQCLFLVGGCGLHSYIQMFVTLRNANIRHA